MGGARAEFRTPVPKTRSEEPFANTLGQLSFPVDDRPHVWMIRIPHCRDADVVLWFPLSGFYNIELKSQPLHKLEDFDPTSAIWSEGVKHSTDDSPWYQATKAGESLRDLVHGDPSCQASLGRPWLSSVAGLFRMRREDFRRKFTGDKGVTGENTFYEKLALEVLFDEDLRSGDAFLDRLRYCRSHPVFGAPPTKLPRKYADHQGVLNALDGVFRPSLHAARSISSYDADRLRNLEQQASRDVEGINWDEYAFCTGHVGTGKTLLGLHVALRSLEVHGGTAYFVCFNKVLATDLDRLLQLDHRYASLSLQVRDIFDLLRRLGDLVGIPVRFGVDPSADASKATPIVVEAFREQARPAPDVLIVDEAQDMPDWGWQLLEGLLVPSTRYFVIESKGQELYRSVGDRSDRLAAVDDIVQENAKRTNYIEKRRVYRNRAIPFLLSQLFMQTYPSTEKAEEVWRNQLRPQYEKSRGQPDRKLALFDIGFDRVGGQCPRLVRVPPTEDAALALVTELVAQGYEANKIRYREDQPCNLLILVPHANDFDGVRDMNWNEVARQACDRCGLRYIDYTVDENRRRGYAGDEVRISTFHSSKGIEGLHVIVLGFDCLGDVAPKFPGGVPSLGYIVLSRSLYEMDVVVLTRSRERQEVSFLEDISEIVGA